MVKVNIDTELRQAFVKGVALAVRKNFSDPREILKLGSDGIIENAREKIKIFSCPSASCGM